MAGYRHAWQTVATGGLYMAKENREDFWESNEKIWEQIKNQVESIKFGNVSITIHEGKIVQLETVKKQRF